MEWLIIAGVFVVAVLVVGWIWRRVRKADQDLFGD